MASLTHRLLVFYQQHPIETTVGFVVVAAMLLIQVGREVQAKDWPQHWSFHHRIHFNRFEHAVPQFTYQVNGTYRVLPYLSTAAKALQNGDSISKHPHADRFYLIRDSADYQLTFQWAWNATTRDFEVAGCTKIRR